MGFSPCTRRYHESAVAVSLPVINLATDIDESCSLVHGTEIPMAQKFLMNSVV